MTNRSRVTDLAYIAVFAALIIVCAFVSIPVGAAGVPVVLQNAVVILTGLVLGARRGSLAVGLFLLLGLVGLPVLAGGRTTLAALAGPTVGYIVGYLVSAFVAGLIAYRVSIIVGGIAGLACQYICGSLGLMLRSELTLSGAALAQVPFLLPDAIKVGAAILIAIGVHKALPDLRRNA
ncbi:biotin transporter BioY [Corynebacterium tapiri]|uniref:Biotin transporter n=1 Tax=Corynebacterium tapiri TaxID=1448266 RepID=A0A5C4U6W7_9CORY|nr:biotin transporter BioY [Corynebacterium tapiri]TNL99241.1 biotin transporter BioY [Corynebacterium tapiri]